jgi:hypothetical protein
LGHEPERRMSEEHMVEVACVDDHRRAQAIVALLKAKGLPTVGFWPQDMLRTSIGIIGHGFAVGMAPRLRSKEPQGPFAISVPEDIAAMARDYLATSSAQQEIEERLRTDRGTSR